MKAVLLPGNSQAVVEDVPDPVAGPGQVVIRVRASALCRSDMSLYYGNPIVGTDVSTVIPGHEAAGDVVEVGRDVTHVHVGDRVAVHLAFGCMHCEYCRSGYLMLCPEWKCLGFDVNGGDAEYVVVPAVNCLPLPHEMSFEAGAVATDMVGTQFSAQDRLSVSGATTVAIFGLGPMGIAGVMIAKARGAKVICVDPLQGRLDLAGELGADVMLAPREDTILGEIREHSDGGPHVCIDCSGNPAAQNWALDVARKWGRVAFIGESRQTTFNPSDQVLRKLLTVIGAWYFPIWQWDTITQFVISHRLPIEKMVTHRFGLESAPEAFRLFDERKTEKVVFTA